MPRGLAIDVTELLTRQCNSWRVNNWRHFLDVIRRRLIEEDLVVVLQRAQIDVSLQIVVFSLVSFIGTDDLLFQRLYERREQSVQTKLAALFFGERCPLAQQWSVEKVHPPRDSRRDHFCDSFCDWLRHIFAHFQ